MRGKKKFWNGEVGYSKQKCILLNNLELQENARI